MCRAFLKNLLQRPDVTRADWVAFQACLDDRLMALTGYGGTALGQTSVAQAVLLHYTE
jgi:hypothetical protein